jgi:hypothetical protein
MCTLMEHFTMRCERITECRLEAIVAVVTSKDEP